MKKLLAVLFLCVTAFRAEAAAPDVVRLGVMRFLSRTDGVSEPQAAAVGDVFTRMLTSSKGIAVIERDQLDAIASEHKLAASGILDANTAITLGKIVGCQYMLMGSVTNLSKKDTSSDFWLFGEKREEATATVDARVVNVETSEVVLSMSETGTSAQRGSNFNFYGIATATAELSGMEGRAIAVAASNLGFKIREALVGEYPQVVGVSDKEVTINAGNTSGVDKGRLFRIYAEGAEVLNTDGSRLGRRVTNIAVVEVDDAQSDFSIAHVLKGGGNPGLIQRGDKVSPISRADAASLVKQKAFAKSRPKPRGNRSSLDSLLGSSAPSEPAPADVSEPAPAAGSGRAMENHSTSPRKVIDTYGLSNEEKKALRNEHLRAAKLADKRVAYNTYAGLADSFSGDYLAAYQAGVVARSMGERDKAAEWFDRALSINPNYEPAKEAQANLR